VTEEIVGGLVVLAVGGVLACLDLPVLWRRYRYLREWVCLGVQGHLVARRSQAGRWRTGHIVWRGRHKDWHDMGDRFRRRRDR
jgi:hypothetical protein